MVDVSKIVKFVEQSLGNKSNQDGKIQKNNAAEYSLFMAEMGKKVRTEGLGKDEFNNMLNEAMGLELSGTHSAANTGEANAPAAARGGGFGNEPTDININISINIDIDIVVKACGGSDADIQKLVDMLIAEMTKEGGSVEAFILGLIKAFAESTNIDMSSLTSLLNEIKTKLEQQGETIENLDKKVDKLQESIDNLKAYIKAELDNLYFSLSSELGDLGIDISSLTQLIETDDEKILTKLGEIHSAIMELTGKFDSFTDVEQKRFEQVMAAIGSINIGSDGDVSGVLSKLDLMYTLLLSIQTDTTKTKENSETLITMVQEGNEAILTAIANINAVGGSYDDTEIKQMLTEILTNMVKKGDLDVQLTKFNQIIANLQAAIENKIDNTAIDIKAYVSEAISKINIIGNGYDDTEIKAMLADILSNMVTKGDLEAQTVHFDTLLANLQKALELKINASTQEIKNAMVDVEKNVKLAIANITIDPGNPDNSGLITLLNNIMAKLEQMDTNNASNFQAVFNAIAQIKPGEVDLSAVMTLLNEIKTIAGKNGEGIQNVLKNQETISLILNGIADKLDGIGTLAQEIKDIVSRLKNCECDHFEGINEETLRKVLCEFIQAIMDNQNPTEGIEEVLGARVAAVRSALRFEDDTAVRNPKADKDSNDSAVYDLHSKKVEGPLKPGIYIKNGKKILVK